jgi:hypothetical protein
MYSYKSLIDGGADSDLIYYNANIISTTQNGVQSDVIKPPIIRFSESRDAPIVRDASQYYFSIIRFAMNGPNKNLPLFIPIIQTNGPDFPDQQDPNRTIYYTSIAYQREWYYTNTSGAIVSKIFTIMPGSSVVPYIPETQNKSIAPIPIPPLNGITKQDLSTRYYWVYTYKHWCSLVNLSMNTAMGYAYDQFKDIWTADSTIDQAVSPFPYPTFDDFLADHDVPFIKYNEDTKTFEIYGDTRAFNVSGQLTGLLGPLSSYGFQDSIPVWTPPAVPVAPSVAVRKSAPYLRLFFNNNLFGLFSNFNNTYLNASYNSSIYWPLTGSIPQLISPLGVIPFSAAPLLYTNEILFTNQQYTNILNNNPTLQNVQIAIPPAYNPYFLIPASKQNLYWISKQDYSSTGSLWSPIQSIVFTSTLLPVKSEYSGQPIQLGSSNAFSTSSSTSYFEPIISDFVIDGQLEKAEGWRDFTLYEPTAEFKMVSLTSSNVSIKDIDIQVYWKYRLTGELIPLTMYNTSDVSMKMMFRRIDYRS